jgi:kynurenine 3-monooxygenase
MDKHVQEGGSLYINRRGKARANERVERRTPRGSSSWTKIFKDLYEARKENADAIADMAIENFIEMRDKVADPQFQLEKAVEKILQKEFPNDYRSRYSLVTFSNVPYSFAMRAGIVIDEILKELTGGIESAEKVDLGKARKLISTKLAPLLNEQQAVLNAV